VPTISFARVVAAPPERVFDLARSIDLHVVTALGTDEQAVSGRTTGLIELDEEVTWEARHLGVRQRLTSKITAFDRPRHFRDEMVRGAFASFEHDHYFEPHQEGTMMREVFAYRSPLGVLGRVADVLFLEAYMRRFLTTRADVLKQFAENDGWRQFLDCT
jgi:ligand-binding SRPBCC domain-containing protein